MFLKEVMFKRSSQPKLTRQLWHEKYYFNPFWREKHSQLHSQIDNIDNMNP